MRAVVMRRGRLVVDEVADPVPGAGEVLVRTLACGICGSDLHALQHAEEMVRAGREAGSMFWDLDRDVVMGHEFCAEILEAGPETAGRLAPGTQVVSMPVLPREDGRASIGYSNDAPGGYGELMLLSEALLLPVPDELPAEHAAMTEPMAVGEHAVAAGRLEPDDSAVVIGCGPVGLAVIAALRLRGVAPIVAADFSVTRRELAEGMGAHEVVDPQERVAIDAWRGRAGERPPVIFECVGVPGMIRQTMDDAPRGARIVVAGVCMQDDVIRPLTGIHKQLNLQFVLGYTPQEFADSLAAIAKGLVDVSPLITRCVDLDGVPDAFRALADPEGQAKIMVLPGVRPA